MYGAYQLEWTISNGDCSGMDTVWLNFAEGSQAGDNQLLCDTLLTTLEGNVPTLGIGSWTKVSGPGNITFTDSGQPDTDVEATLYGSYLLQWEITNGTCSTEDTVRITFGEEPVITDAKSDTICNAETTNIVISTSVPGTSLVLEVVYDGSIIGASTALDGDTLRQTLTNPGISYDSVVYKVSPTGPIPTSCTGVPDTIIVWVEPTLAITAEPDTLCNEDFTNIDPQSVNNTTRGMRYTWTVNDPSGFITGEAPSVGNGYPLSRNIIQQLSNSDTDAHEVIYTLTPHSIRGDSTLRCAGTPIDVTIWVEPALTITAEADTLCNEDFTTSIRRV